MFPYTLDGGMLDYYENTLCNHIMASCSHDSSGGTTYFMPLGPGGAKEYSTTENTCCHGTGMESRFRYMENIFAQDESFLYVNLLVDAVLSGELEARTLSPGVIQVQALSDLKKGLKIHIPAWAQEKLAVEGGAASHRLEDGFLVVEKPLGAGERVVLRLPMELRETALGGLAATPTGRAVKERMASSKKKQRVLTIKDARWRLEKREPQGAK